MKTQILLALAVMAAVGCETTQEKAARMESQGLVRTQEGKWVPKGTRFFGSGHPMEMPDGGPVPIAFDPTVFNQAMAAQQQAPVPVIVAGQNAGTTIATQSQYGTVVSTFGGPLNLAPPPPPIYTGNQNPVVYTMPLQQP